MFGRTIFDPVRVEWQFQCWEWYFENFGGWDRFQKQTLVTPTGDFFPYQPNGSHEYATVVFETVKDWMGMDTWSCDFIQVEDGDPFLGFRANVAYADSESDSEGAKVYYARSMLRDQAELIATLSHELSHCLLASTVTPPPKDAWHSLEPMTDLCAAFRGFGIFMANAAFPFRQKEGYLSDSELAFGLAIFCTLKGIAVRPVAQHLRANPRGYFKRAMKELRHHSERLEQIRKVEPVMGRD